jgi:hypothetical protein
MVWRCGEASFGGKLGRQRVAGVQAWEVRAGTRCRRHVGATAGRGVTDVRGDAAKLRVARDWRQWQVAGLLAWKVRAGSRHAGAAAGTGSSTCAAARGTVAGVQAWRRARCLGLF